MDLPPAVGRGQRTQKGAAGTADQGAAEGIIAEQVSSRGTRARPQRTARGGAALGMVKRAGRHQDAAGQKGNGTTSSSWKSLMDQLDPACRNVGACPVTSITSPERKR